MMATASHTATEPHFDRFSLWGTTGVLGVTDAAALEPARRRLDALLAEIEEAASRFRPNTEILRLNEAAGTGAFRVSATLLDLICVALEWSSATDGACDPTVADSLIALGYDRDFDHLSARGPELPPGTVHPAPGTKSIEVDREASTVSLPHGVHLDLGATAKARAADRGAEVLAHEFQTGALVDLGGDLRVAGPAPENGWQIGIVTSARTHELDDVQEVVSIRSGAVASSSTAVRRWQRGDAVLHHIVDPATGSSASTTFSLVTVVAPTCTEANALATAGVVWGEDALFELPQRAIAARLVRSSGEVERLGAWPSAEEATS
jgi:FAD:protein FMN transferase